MVICTSPRIIAAYRVLRRLPEPRHPPNALLLSFVSLQFLFLVFVFSMSMIVFLVENKGLEPLTPCVQGRCSKPTELIPRAWTLSS